MAREAPSLGVQQRGRVLDPAPVPLGGAKPPERYTTVCISTPWGSSGGSKPAGAILLEAQVLAPTAAPRLQAV